MLEYLEAHYIGVIIVIISIVILGTWIAWVFSIGRYRGASKSPGVMLVLSDLIVEIIDDFRHVLALMLITIFASALAYAMYQATSFEELTSALQFVMSSLGGLVGSIVGYYFGESAIKKAIKIKVTDDLEQEDAAIKKREKNVGEVETPN